MLVFGLLGDAMTRKYNKYILKVSTVLIITMGLMLAMKGIKMLRLDPQPPTPLRILHRGVFVIPAKNGRLFLLQLTYGFD